MELFDLDVRNVNDASLRRYSNFWFALAKLYRSLKGQNGTRSRAGSIESVRLYRSTNQRTFERDEHLHNKVSLLEGTTGSPDATLKSQIREHQQMKENEKSEKSFTGTRAPRAAPSKVLQNACFQKRVVVFKNLFRGPKLRFSKSRFPVIVSLVNSPRLLKVHSGTFHTEARV